ncbi:hypothetical protein CEK29_15275 [Bordetella genomosp. 5]|uniref:Yip1 domain-containing protein n=1 Tax=Bordetella genomosp. 5 TaxID=1395608 RepID=A0A261TE79_9BORD|nr:hypothetical protein [Bordetella genomosp. 5]OZI41300.1 hypothetical protein CEK29_15275 [Bordetella genomosp. 5]OZI47956.1 hypothetical protein CAL25_16325 [Bordetella genomosp. 5]
MIDLLRASWRAALLKPLPLSAYDYPTHWSVLAVMLVGIASGAQISMGTVFAPQDPSIAQMLMPRFMATEMAGAWGAMLAVWLVSFGWLRVTQRWDGEGSLFNLIIACWFVLDMVVVVLSALGLPNAFLIAVLLYSPWVLATALSAAMPDVRRPVAAAWSYFALVPAFTISMLAHGAVASKVFATGQ